MKKWLGLFIVSASLVFFACDDSSSTGPDDLSYIDENGEEVSIEVSTDNFKDSRDGQSYSTVTVGKQTWMTENLNYEAPGIDVSDELYNWSTAQSVCPDGWHLPSKDEWQDLFQIIEKVYGDSGAWALKSSSGWDNDTLSNGEIVSGNGGDILGFNAKPTGICRGSDCRYKGQMTGFWARSKMDGDGYASYIRFETDEDWSSGEIYRDARLHVRCISDKNTLFESLGRCVESKEGTVGEYDSVFYVCRENIWEVASLTDKLDYAFGPCDAGKENKRFVLQDTSYICVAEVSSSMDIYPIYNPSAATETSSTSTTSYHWWYTPRDSIFADCLARDDSVCQYRDSTFYRSMSSYFPAKPNEVYGECTKTKMGEIVKLNKNDYICRGKAWYVPNEAELEYGLCDDSRLYDTVSVKNESFICVNNLWMESDFLEDTLGFCLDDGAKATFRSLEYVCDASTHKWYHEFTDSRDGQKYRAVVIRGKMVMDSDLKYGGKDKFSWSEAMALEPECDTTACSIDDTLSHQGICPDGWFLPTTDFYRTLYDEFIHRDYSQNTIGLLMSQNGWIGKNFSNGLGLNLTPNMIDSVYSPVEVSVSWQCAEGNYFTMIDNIPVSIPPEDVCGVRTGGDLVRIDYTSRVWLSGRKSYYLYVREGVAPSGVPMLDGLEFGTFSPTTTTAAVRCVTDSWL